MLGLDDPVLYLLASVVITYVDVLGLLGGELGLGHGMSSLIVKMKSNRWALSLEHIELVNKVLEPEGIAAGFT